MKLSKALRIFGYSVVKLATMPVLLTPLYKYLNWYMGYYLFFILICKLHVYYLRLHFIFFILMHFLACLFFLLFLILNYFFKICSLLAMTTTFRFWISYPSRISQGAIKGHHYVPMVSVQKCSS